MTLFTKTARLGLALASAALLGFTQVAPVAAAGSTRWVSTSGSDSGNCTVSPCLTIGYAVGQAKPGNTISVAAGTYDESVSITKRLKVIGHHATIDAAGLSQLNGVVISGAAAAGTVLRGFTIEDAALEGIFVNKTTRITITGNTVVDNDTEGPYGPDCVAQPDDCGEAIHLQTVTHSRVSGNLVQNNIGGILLTDEDGPTWGNVISGNRVLDNTLDCGITLASHWFDPTASSGVKAGVGGVYRNLVVGNVSNGNGAAGIGVFAGPPGAAAWGNVVVGNVARNNGEGGVMIHSHTPAQYASANVVVNNTLSGNGIDTDNPGDDASTGISIFSAVVPIQRTIVAANRISNEHYGINAWNAPGLYGLHSNHFAASVAVPIATN